MIAVESASDIAIRFAAFHNAEVEKWWPLIKAAGIKSE
jgi:hypothetical protein